MTAMSGYYHRKFACRALLATLPMVLLGASASASTEMASPDAPADPLRFFEGRTEMVSTVKVIAKKAYRSRTMGEGEIGRDGTLHLVQHIQEAGRAHDRRWRIRQVGPQRFAGTMTEAIGPVVAEQVGSRYRFRFKMKGNLTIEQWLTPLPGGKSARSKLSARKFGVVVGRSEGTIRKL